MDVNWEVLETRLRAHEPVDIYQQQSALVPDRPWLRQRELIAGVIGAIADAFALHRDGGWRRVGGVDAVIVLVKPAWFPLVAHSHSHSGGSSMHGPLATGHSPVRGRNC